MPFAPIADRSAAGPSAARDRVAGAIVAGVAAMLWSPRERARPADMRLRLVATLFGRASNVIMVAIAAGVCGVVSWARGGCALSAQIASLEVLVLLARCSVIIAFHRKHREGVAMAPDAWLARFGVLAVFSSLSWGALCFIALATSHDPLLYVIPILATVGTAGAVAARNSAVPRLARMQLFCSLAPIVAGCMLADDHGFRVLLILVPAMAAGLVILIAERNEQLVELIETQAELARLSQTDALTQLPNRRSLDARLDRAATTGGRYALLMIDVDHFKAFNDRNGHPAGDALLRQIATVLRQTLRGKDDVVARYGGEEFAVLLEGASGGEAAAIAERLRLAVQAGCRHPLDGTLVTISVGCAGAHAGEAPRTALREADAALYRAKRGGRNRVECAAATPDDRAVA